MLKRFAVVILLLSLVIMTGIYVWARIPPSIDRHVPDPAAVYIADRLEPGVPLRENYFQHGEHTLHYVEAGTGETILFLHGFPSFWLSLLRQFEHFSGDYHVVAIDGLGAGKSDGPADVNAYTLDAMSEHIVALLDHMDVDRAHIVGHDWGSVLGIGFAQQYPERVYSVTGIGAPALNANLYALEKDPKARETAGYVEQFKRANPPLLVLLGTAGSIYEGAYAPLVEDGKLSVEEGHLFRQGTRDPKRTNAHINWYRANLPHPDDLDERDFWPSRDRRITVPALYIWGDADPIYNETAMTRMINLSDQSKTLMFSDIGHWPHVRNADDVNAAIAAHITAAQIVEPD